MTRKKNTNVTVITWLVAIVTGIIVIIFPLVFFFHSYQNTAAMLEVEAEINAGALTNIISANSDFWEFEDIRLMEYLQGRPKGKIPEIRRIINNKNETVCESSDALQPPFVMRSAELMDSGDIVGRIEIYRSLWPLWKQTALLFLVMLPVGLSVFLILRIIPIRSLSRAEEALFKSNENLEETNKLLQEEISKCRQVESELYRLNEELENRVAERTRQLEAQITERMNAEKNLSASEEKYRNFLENAPIGICITDLAGNIQYINRRIEEGSGWKREELLSRNALDLGFFDEDTKQVLLERLYARLKGDAPRTTEIPVICKNGTRHWIDLKTTVLYQDGRPDGLQLAFLNITERKFAEDALRESEKKYRFLTDKMLDVVWITDLNLRTTYVSPSIKSALGFTPEERIAQDVREQVTPASLSATMDILTRQYELEQSGQADPERNVTYEVEYYRKDGSIQLSENIVSAVRNDQGVAIGFHGVSRDVTKRKEIEKALRESERKYRELVNFLPLSLFEMDLDGNITSANPAILETFGYKQSHLQHGLNAFQMIVPGELEKLKSNLQQLLLWERKDPTEYTGIRKDGTTFPFMIFSSIIINNGKPVGLRGAIIDLTKQKEAEFLLQKSEKKYRELIDFLPIAIYEIDLQGNIVSGNPEIFKLFGYAKSDLEKGLNALQNLIEARDRNRAVEIMLRIINGEKTGGSEFTGIRKDGSPFPFLNVASPIINENKPVGLRGAIIDLSKQKQTEKDLQNARDMLLQSEKLAAIGRLSAGVAHEILNPVNIISLELQILQNMEKLPSAILEELKICMDQINRIVIITDNLKEFSRIPKRKMTITKISTVIDYVINLCATQLKIEGIRAEVHYQKELPAIYMDKEKMEQVIMNLISNAMAFMEGKEKKVLRITVQKETLPGRNDQLKIMIADTGTGIKTENMSKIFEPFFTTKKPGKGTGLGLSISYGIIHDHGGMIWAENNIWGGASFYIRLPIDMDHNEKHQPKEG